MLFQHFVLHCVFVTRVMLRLSRLTGSPESKFSAGKQRPAEHTLALLCSTLTYLESTAAGHSATEEWFPSQLASLLQVF